MGFQNCTPYEWVSDGVQKKERMWVKTPYRPVPRPRVDRVFPSLLPKCYVGWKHTTPIQWCKQLDLPNM